jgi:hypothetical protein
VLWSNRDGGLVNRGQADSRRARGQGKLEGKVKDHAVVSTFMGYGCYG